MYNAGYDSAVRTYDVTINSIGYMFARQDNLGIAGARSWKRVKPVKAPFYEGFPEVQRGNSDGEYIIDLLPRADSSWGEDFKTRPSSYLASTLDPRWPGMLIGVPDFTSVSSGVQYGQATCLVEVPGYAYVFIMGTRYGYKIDATAPGTKTEFDLGAGVVARQAAAFKGYIYIACGTTIKRVDPSTASGTTGVTSTTLAIDAICATTNESGGLLARAYRVSGATYISTCPFSDDPMDSTKWSTGVPLIETTDVFEWLFNYGYAVYAGCPSGLFAFDQAFNSYNVLAQAKVARATGNCTQVQQWGSGFVVPTLSGIFYVDPTNNFVDDISPHKDINILPSYGAAYMGTYRGLVVNGDEIYCMTRVASTTSTLFVGKRDANGKVQWHTLQALVSSSGPAYFVPHISGLSVDSTHGKLFIAGANGNYIYKYIPAVGNPLSDSTATFSHTERFFTTGRYGLSGSGNITFEELAIRVVNHATGSAMHASVSMENGGAGVVGSAVTTDGISILRPSAADIAAGYNVGTAFQASIFVTGATSTLSTPIVLSAKARVIVRELRAETIEFNLLLGAGVSNRAGFRPPESLVTQYANLKALESVTTPFPVIDPISGSTLSCLVDGDITFSEVAQFDSQYPQALASGRLRVVGSS